MDQTDKRTKGDSRRAGEEISLFPDVSPQEWLETEEEGQLSVDVHETDREIVIRSAIAGVRPEDIDVSIHNDMLTIRGRRHSEREREEGRCLIRECHWGAFSRSLILPAEVDSDRIAAELKSGVLTVRLPKTVRDRKIEIKGEEE